MRRVVRSLTLVPILLLAIAPAALAARPSTGFTGSWEAIDPLDGSNLRADISGAKTTQIVYTDDNATNACEGASTAAFSANLVGWVDGNEMFTTMSNASCGTQPLPFRGLQIAWFLDDGGNSDPADDVLSNSFGEEYTRAD
jgi:hypothetical protein